MRISDSAGSHFTLKRIEANPRGDIHAKVSAAALGFAGANKSVWFDGVEIGRFLVELQRLEASLQGTATLETMSPGECVMILRNLDRLGHLMLDVSIARAVFSFGETDHFRCRIRFDISPTALRDTVEALSLELNAP